MCQILKTSGLIVVMNFEVKKRAHLRFTIQQIKAYYLKMNLSNVEGDDGELIDPQFVDSREEGVIPEID